MQTQQLLQIQLTPVFQQIQQIQQIQPFQQTQTLQLQTRIFLNQLTLLTKLIQHNQLLKKRTQNPSQLNWIIQLKIL